MASMEKDEVLRRLDRMIAKAEKKGKTRKRLALIIVKDGYMANCRLSRYGDCNTCREQMKCGMAPVAGGTVRRNCPHYKGPDLMEPWRGESK